MGTASSRHIRTGFAARALIISNGLAYFQQTLSVPSVTTSVFFSPGTLNMHMQKKTIRLGAGCAGLILAVLLSGCASLGPGHTDYSDLPGSGDQMAKGPGIFHAGKDQDYKGGYRVFSNEPGKKALFNTDANNQAGAKATGGNQTQAQSASPGNVPPSKQQEFRQFQEYQQFKNFQHMSKESPEYNKFREWQDWKQYQQWKNSGNSTNP